MRLTHSTLTRRLHTAHRIISLRHALNPPIQQSTSDDQLKAGFLAQFFAAFHQTIHTPCNTNHVTHQARHQNLCQAISFTNFDKRINPAQQNAELGVYKFIQNIQKAKDFASGDEALAFLDDLGIKPSKELIYCALCDLKEQWKLAFLVYKWGENWGCNDEKTCHLIVWILGRHQKFSTAWSVIRDLYCASMDTEQSILILIDRYAAANCSEKAIQTFQMMEKFKLSPDQKTFLALLNILCRHGFVEKAEEYMFLNKKLFPLDTQAFNIILSGWCNVTVDIYEAKRVWREMSNCCVVPDGMSYTHMISCFSKVGNLFDSLRLYDEMKKRGWIPGAEVYDSLIYVLTCENCLNEALKIVEKMKDMGLQPDSSTYNSMIRPLCQDMKSEEAKSILARMIGDNVRPTVDTYHAFLTNANLEATLQVLCHMKKASLGPTSDTFLLILGKLFKLKQPGDALKIWEAMGQYEIVPLSAHYNILVEGLAKYGFLVEARRFHAELLSKGMIADPKLNKLIKDPAKENDREREEKQTRFAGHVNNSKQGDHGRRGWLQSKKHMNWCRRKKTTRV